MTGIEQFIELFMTSPVNAIGAILGGPLLIVIYILAILILPFYQSLVP